MTIAINICPQIVYIIIQMKNSNSNLLSQKQEKSNFSLIHFNCRSLPSNYNKLKDSINALYLKFDVIALSETWLIDNDSDKFNIDGYKWFTCSRTNKSGGGVALYINDPLQHKYLPDMSKCLDNCAEVVSLEIRSPLLLKMAKKSINMLHLSCTKN